MLLVYAACCAGRHSAAAAAASSRRHAVPRSVRGVDPVSRSLIIAWLLTSLTADEWKCAARRSSRVAVVVFAASLPSRRRALRRETPIIDVTDPLLALSRRVSDSRAHDVSRLELARRDAARRAASVSPSTPSSGRSSACARGRRAGGRCRCRVGDEIAPLIGAGPGEIAMLPNVTIAQTSVLSALDYSNGRDTIVMTELDFPSVRYVYDELATRLGARIVVVPSDDGIGIDTQRVLDAIDERTRLVAISHVLFRSAYIMDVERDLRARARGRRARVARRVSFGRRHSGRRESARRRLPERRRVEVAVRRTGRRVSLCVAGGDEPLVAVVHRLAGARASVRVRGRDGTTRDNAWRWLNGTPPIPALFAAIEGPRIVRRAGIERVRAKSMRQTSRLIELADARGYTVTAPRDAARRGGTVAFDVPHAYGVAQALLANDVIVDYRPNAGIRIAPHFYTSDDELDARRRHDRRHSARRERGSRSRTSEAR